MFPLPGRRFQPQEVGETHGGVEAVTGPKGAARSMSRSKIRRSRTLPPDDQLMRPAGHGAWTSAMTPSLAG